MSEKRKRKRNDEESEAKKNKNDRNEEESKARIVRNDSDDSIVEVWLVRKPNVISVEDLQNNRWRSSKPTKIKSSAGLFVATTDDSLSLNSAPSFSVALPVDNGADANYNVHHVNGIIRIEPHENDEKVVEDPIELCQPPTMPNGLKQRYVPFGCPEKKKKKRKAEKKSKKQK